MPRSVLKSLIAEIERWLDCVTIFWWQRLALALHDGSFYLRHTLAVRDASDRALEELHRVARQGTSLITQHGVYHTELFIQVGRSRERGSVRLFVVHRSILVQEAKSLENLHQLQRNVKRDWNKIAV